MKVNEATGEWEFEFEKDEALASIYAELGERVHDIWNRTRWQDDYEPEAFFADITEAVFDCLGEEVYDDEGTQAEESL
jgi:hypothetical protein